MESEINEFQTEQVGGNIKTKSTKKIYVLSLVWLLNQEVGVK